MKEALIDVGPGLSYSVWGKAGVCSRTIFWVLLLQNGGLAMLCIIQTKQVTLHGKLGVTSLLSLLLLLLLYDNVMLTSCLHPLHSTEYTTQQCIYTEHISCSFD